MECPSQQHQGAIPFELTGAPERLEIWRFQSLKNRGIYIESMIDLARPKTISQGQKSILRGQIRYRKAKNRSRKAKTNLARPKIDLTRPKTISKEIMSKLGWASPPAFRRPWIRHRTRSRRRTGEGWLTRRQWWWWLFQYWPVLGQARPAGHARAGQAGLLLHHLLENRNQSAGILLSALSVLN